VSLTPTPKTLLQIIIKAASLVGLPNNLVEHPHRLLRLRLVPCVVCEIQPSQKFNQRLVVLVVPGVLHKVTIGADNEALVFVAAAAPAVTVSVFDFVVELLNAPATSAVTPCVVLFMVVTHWLGNLTIFYDVFFKASLVHVFCLGAPLPLITNAVQC